MNQKYSEITFKNYLDTVERSGILIPFDNSQYNGNELANKLKKCRLVAQKEFIVCHSEIVEIFNHIIKIEKGINDDINRIQNKFSTYKDIWNKFFNEFNFRLTEIFNYGYEKLIGSFENKVKRINNFTICLFGRTKVGKSTTMEALTKGNGTTIGDGKQNTTILIKEYFWNNLKVVDTPGIDAMQEIDQLENLALTFADNSDLIAFLMPHQIEEGDFQKFSLFYKQNKPILIILNIKESVGKEGSQDMEMFIKNSDRIFDEKKIQDYKDRINAFIFNSLKIEKDLVPIIPVHSNAAFVSNHVTDENLKKKLYSISNFPNFENLLLKEVTNYGELYRIKNPHETVKLFTEKITNELNLFNSYLTEQQKVFHNNIVKFTTVKNKIQQNQNTIIQNNIENFFNIKNSSVTYIVNQIFDTKKEKERENILNNFISENEVKSCVEKADTEIQNVIKKEIQDYFDAFSKELNLVDLEYSKSNFNYSTNQKMQNLEDIKFRKNLVEGAGLITGVVGGIGLSVVAMEGTIVGATGTLFGFGGANIWNPVGWILIGSGVILSITGRIFAGRRKKKIAEAKINATNELKSALNKTKFDVISKINNKNNDVINQIKKDHIDVLSEYLLYSKKYQTEIKHLTSLIENISTNSEKNKYQAMFNNIYNSDYYNVRDVFQKDNNISIFLNEIPMNVDEIQKVFSRVEEKQINILKA